MFGLEEKVTAVCLVALLACGAYAGYEHMKAQAAQIDRLTQQVQIEQANTKAAQAEATANRAAMDTRAATVATAQTRTRQAQVALADAIKAEPSAANVVVPESYWQAIYGADDAGTN